ncbi:MAG TPA: TMEM175 family protein [Caulobacteraceae bacterium]|jgi:uncharacterized membrane protein|nr:TMEM175 family protein [Caulobacteraceae bacterium]
MAGEPESLDRDESLARRRHRHWYDRLIMLSDGVFAISMTLLALDIRAPAAGRLEDLWAALAPQLDAYTLSFLVISVYWLAHRRFMAMILTVDAPITVVNLVMLGLVGLLPAATRLAHASGPLPSHMLIYGALVVAIAIALAVLWGYAALAPGRVSPEVGLAERWFLFALILIAPPLFLVITSVLRGPPPGTVPLLLAALFLVGWRMRQWVTRRLARPAAAP